MLVSIVTFPFPNNILAQLELQVGGVITDAATIPTGMLQNMIHVLQTAVVH